MKLGMICLEGSSPLISLLPSLWFYQCTLDSQAALLLTHTLATWEEGLSPSDALALPPAPVPGAPFSWGMGRACESQLLG